MLQIIWCQFPKATQVIMTPHLNQTFIFNLFISNTWAQVRWQCFISTLVFHTGVRIQNTKLDKWLSIYLKSSLPSPYFPNSECTLQFFHAFIWLVKITPSSYFNWFYRRCKLQQCTREKTHLRQQYSHSHTEKTEAVMKNGITETIRILLDSFVITTLKITDVFLGILSWELSSHLPSNTDCDPNPKRVHLQVTAQDGTAIILLLSNWNGKRGLHTSVQKRSPLSHCLLLDPASFPLPSRLPRSSTAGGLQ